MDCLSQIAHRPYPIPAGRPRWRQKWLDLAFFHWPIDVEMVKALLPDGLELDTYEGLAWLSVVPFRMEDVMLRGLPAVPNISNFPELNLRTYVIKDGKPGVWFFSLDADQRLAVWAAKTFFHLPYFKALMRCDLEGERVIYSSRREEGDATFAAEYQPVGEVYYAHSGTLEHWLTERYCLYSYDGTHLYRGDIHHCPWPLQKINYDISQLDLGSDEGFTFTSAPVAAQFARELEVAIWPLERCD